jgi:hypothetical protein
LPSLIEVIKSRRVRYARHVGHRKAYLVENAGETEHLEMGRSLI